MATKKEQLELIKTGMIMMAEEMDKKLSAKKEEPVEDDKITKDDIKQLIQEVVGAKDKVINEQKKEIEEKNEQLEQVLVNDLNDDDLSFADKLREMMK